MTIACYSEKCKMVALCSSQGTNCRSARHKTTLVPPSSSSPPWRLHQRSFTITQNVGSFPCVENLLIWILVLDPDLGRRSSKLWNGTLPIVILRMVKNLFHDNNDHFVMKVSKRQYGSTVGHFLHLYKRTVEDNQKHYAPLLKQVQKQKWFVPQCALCIFLCCIFLCCITSFFEM